MAGRWVGYVAIAMAAAAASAAVTLGLSGGSDAAVGGAPAASTSVASPKAGTLAVGSPAACAPVTASAPAWPVAALKGLPTLNGATISSVQHQNGTLAIQFGVPNSFLNIAAQLRTSLPPLGYALFGGDQEAREADVRFISGTLTGGFKLVDVGSCYSRGILAVVDPSS